MYYKAIQYVHAHTHTIYFPASSSKENMEQQCTSSLGCVQRRWWIASPVLAGLLCSPGKRISQMERVRSLHLLERRAVEPFFLKDSSFSHFSQEEKRPWAWGIFTELWVGFMPPSGHKLKTALWHYQFLGDLFVSFRGPFCREISWQEEQKTQLEMGESRVKDGELPENPTRSYSACCSFQQWQWRAIPQHGLREPQPLWMCPSPSGVGGHRAGSTRRQKGELVAVEEETIWKQYRLGRNGMQMAWVGSEKLLTASLSRYSPSQI